MTEVANLKEALKVIDNHLQTMQKEFKDNDSGEYFVPWISIVEMSAKEAVLFPALMEYIQSVAPVFEWEFEEQFEPRGLKIKWRKLVFFSAD